MNLKLYSIHIIKTKVHCQTNMKFLNEKCLTSVTIRVCLTMNACLPFFTLDRKNAICCCCGEGKGEEGLVPYSPSVEAFPFGCLMPYSKKHEKGKDTALK